MSILLGTGNTMPYVWKEIYLLRCSDFWGHLSLCKHDYELPI